LYIRNNENIGPDNNFIQCFKLSQGKYFWLLGDDDVVIEGAIEKIINLLKSEREFGVIHLNSYPFLNDYRKEAPKKQRDYVKIYESPKKFLKDINCYITFISTNIINKKLSLVNINIESFRNTNLIQLSWLLNAFSNSKFNAFIGYYCVAAKLGNTGGYKLSEVFGYNFERAFEIYKISYYFKIISDKMLVSFFPANIIRARIGMLKAYREDYFQSLYPLFYKNFRFWLFTVPAIILPVKLAYIIYSIINYLKKLRRNI
jgi:hypothetical protein